MSRDIQIDEKVVQSFHQMWDGFPGIARLVHQDRIIVASNPIAREMGFVEGAVCTKIGDPKIHRGCLMNTTFETKTAQTDASVSGKIRGWVPIEGYDDLLVHFTLGEVDKIVESEK